MLIKPHIKYRGYTLVELSISLTIIAVLFTGGLNLFSKTDEAQRYRITMERQAKIQQAIEAFVHENKYLPCPASGNTPESSSTFGRKTAYASIVSTNVSAVASDNSLVNTATIFSGMGAGTVVAVSGFTNAANNGYFTVTTKTAATKIIVSGTTSLVSEAAGSSITMVTHSCNAVENETGMVPIHDLMLSDDYAYDGWERKFTYRIATGMGNATDWADSLYKGDLRIIDINGNERTDIDRPAPNNIGAAYVIVSHGPNGTGAWAKNTTTDFTAPPSTSRELENANHGINKIYVQNERTTLTRSTGGVGVSTGFDDIVVFKRKDDVMPSLIGKRSINISNNVCTIARTIIAGGYPNVSPPALLRDFSKTNAANAAVADHIYATARAVKAVCDNQGGGCGISPLRIAPNNLQLWLDGNDPFGSGNLPNEGGRISMWKDKSGKGNHATQVTRALQPKFKVGFINRKSTIRFNNDSFLTVPAPLLNSITTDMTVFVVENIDVLSNATVLKSRGSALFHIGIPWGGAALFDFGATHLTAAWGASVDTPYVWTYRISSSSPTEMRIYRNGTSITSQASVGSIAFPSTVMDIGAASPAYLIGDIAEIIIYNSALSDANRAKVETYLNLKWGVSPAVCPDEYKP